MYSSLNHRQGQSGLTRYVSAPGSLLTRIVDSVIESHDEFSNVGSQSLMGHHHNNSNTTTYFSGDSSSLNSDSGYKRSNNNGLPDSKQVYQNQNELVGNGSAPSLQRSSYGLNQTPAREFPTASSLRCNGGGGAVVGGGGTSLTRHSSSPAGFFDHLMIDSGGFSITNGMGGQNSKPGNTNVVGKGRLHSQLSFTGQDSLSQISELTENFSGVSSSDEGFTMGSWEDTKTITFSNRPNKRFKNDSDSELLNCLNDMESQSMFGMPKNSAEMDNNNTVRCKLRAKRGFATHPRSIAERERRGRITDKLGKLLEVTPNVDKQTSTSDMIEMAVQHMIALQNEVEKLKRDAASCTCGCSIEASTSNKQERSG